LGLGRRRTVSAKLLDDARKKLDALKSKIASGTVTEPSRMTVAEWLDSWITDFVEPTRRATTTPMYRSYVAYVKPFIGHLKLQSVTPLIIQKLYTDLQKADPPRSAYTVSRIHARLVTAFKKARELRLIPVNPVIDATPPRAKLRPIAPLSFEQTRAFLEAARGHRLEALFALAISTGMRQGELFALDWRSIDFAKSMVSVRGTLVEVGGKLIVHEPKTDRSRRRIDVPATTMTLLRRHQKATAGQPDDYVFRDTDGGPLRKSNFVRRDFKPLLEKAGLPADLHFHDLRHTHATLLLASGVNAKVTQERLGHSKISTTLDTYSHITPTMQLEAAKTMDSIMKRRRRPRPRAGTLPKT
jgi:integrase